MNTSSDSQKAFVSLVTFWLDERFNYSVEKAISQMGSPAWSSLSVGRRGFWQCQPQCREELQVALSALAWEWLSVAPLWRWQLWQRGPEAKQGGSKSPAKALPEGRGVFTAGMWQALHICSKEKEKPNLVNQTNSYIKLEGEGFLFPF